MLIVWPCRFAYIARKGIQVLQDKFKVHTHKGIHTPLHSQTPIASGPGPTYIHTHTPRPSATHHENMPHTCTCASSLPHPSPPPLPGPVTDDMVCRQLVAFESAFTIEGRSEDELPEVVLGVGKFNKMDVQKGLELQY